MIAGAASAEHYAVLRLAAAIRPFSAAERQNCAALNAVIGRWLGLDGPAVARLARRAVLAERARVLHETLLLDLAPEALDQLVETIEGPSAISEARRGALIVGLHLGLYSSLLPIWLGRLAARGGLPPITLLFDSGGAGALGLPAVRRAALEEAGLLRAGTYALLDVTADPGAPAILDRLRAGQVVLALADARLLPADDWRAARFRVGRGWVGVSRGTFWTAGLVGAPIIPIALRTRADGYVVDLGAGVTAGSRRPAELASAATSALRWLAAVLDGQPSEWALWPALAEAARSPGWEAPCAISVS